LSGIYFVIKKAEKSLLEKCEFVLEIYKLYNQLSKASNINIYFTFLTIYFEAFYMKFLAKSE